MINLGWMFIQHLSIVNAASQPLLWLESLLLTLVHTQLEWHMSMAFEESQCSLTALFVARGVCCDFGANIPSP